MTQKEFHSILDSIKALSPEQMRQLRHQLDSKLAQRAPHEYAGTEETAFDVASRAGLIGCIPDAPRSPTDLSTNPKHMEGFGRG